MIKLLVLLWLATVYMFPSCVHAKRMWEEGRLDLFWKVHYVVGVLAFILLDAAFNLFYGTLIFRERPREWLFSSRVQRLVRAGNKHALVWAGRLNAVDEGHIKI